MNTTHQIFNEFVQTQLNNDQQQAVTQTTGTLLVVAGAGSGKTRVITARIAHLIINKGVDPRSIIALTFTNKAALEMKERIISFLGSSVGQLPFIGTFHSYCLRLLKQNQELLDTPFFSILVEDDQQKILQGIIHKNNLTKQVTAKNLSYQISQLKNQTIDPQLHDSMSTNRLLQDTYNAYEHEKKLSKSLDFDDLLLEGLKLFNHETFKKNFQETVRHVLVDEYQDTNVVQHGLLKAMTTDKKKKFTLDSLCVVGDEDQSIYSWRGATVANIINFTSDFPKTTIVKIEQNYRSVQSILDVANQVIVNNKNRNPKSLWSTKQGADRLRQLVCISEYQEGETIAQYILTLQKTKKLSSVALLYRAHYQSRAIEEALLKHSIPYKIIGGVQFYERKEVKDILAYLRLVSNPFDRVSFSRVLNVPIRGLGAKAEEAIIEVWQQEPFLTFAQAVQKCIDQKLFTGTKAQTLQTFLAVFTDITDQDTASDTVVKLINSITYYSHIKEEYATEEALERIDNIKELINAIKHMEHTGIKTVRQFLDEVALMQDHLTNKNTENAHERVSLMTLHAAKGLEFDHIIISGIEEGVLPGSRSLHNEDALEEERRLFYVGITRARERLLLTYSRYRYVFGQMTDQRPSRFMQEIPTSLVPGQDASYWNSTQCKMFFHQWMGTTNSSNIQTFGSAVSLQPKPAMVAPKRITPKNWKKNQPVKHERFGTGIVKSVEAKGENKIYLTVEFKTGTKKIDAQFVSAI